MLKANKGSRQSCVLLKDEQIINNQVKQINKKIKTRNVEERIHEVGKEKLDFSLLL